MKFVQTKLKRKNVKREKKKKRGKLNISIFKLGDIIFFDKNKVVFHHGKNFSAR